LPLVAPEGTVATTLVALQLVTVAAAPLKVTVLVPRVAPKFFPVIVTGVPVTPEAGFKPVIVGIAVVTVNMTPLLGSPPTLTTTLPVVAPDGAATTMLVALQLVTVAAAPSKVTVLVPCVAPKFAPVIVTTVPAGPELGFRLMIEASGITVKLKPLLAWLPTVTTTLPLVAPEGTMVTMLVALQLLGVAAVPLKATVPWLVPKFSPAITTTLPTWPEAGIMLAMFGLLELLLVHPLRTNSSMKRRKHRSRTSRRTSAFTMKDPPRIWHRIPQG
jgi:hypothetical protein